MLTNIHTLLGIRGIREYSEAVETAMSKVKDEHIVMIGKYNSTEYKISKAYVGKTLTDDIIDDILDKCLENDTYIFGFVRIYKDWNGHNHKIYVDMSCY